MFKKGINNLVLTGIIEKRREKGKPREKGTDGYMKLTIGRMTVV